ncbi:MAG: hypothetical protein KAR57_01175 [Bacteroidales bacterium]|nr:hypothetical protein [Bacteroidales bacterium]
MQKTIIYITVIILITTGCSVYESIYQDPPLNIDGSSSDWTTTLDSKNNSSFSYGISNDNENLYIRININDQYVQKKLMLAGLTVWIDTTGKKKEYMGITCPIQKALPKMNRKIQNQAEWKKDQLLEIDFLGFKEYGETYFISKNPYGVEVSIDQDQFKSLYYEMKIPVKSIYTDHSNLALKTLSIGLETGALKIPSQTNRPAVSQSAGISGRGKGGRGGGAGGRGGGKGGGPSGRTPDSSSITNMTSPTKIWIKNIKLAQQ